MSSERGLQDLKKVLKDAQASDIEYVIEPVCTHSLSDEVKTGYRPRTIKGVALPDNLGIVYVRAEDKGGTYWYILNRNSVDENGKPNETIYQTEDDVKTAVFEEMIAVVSSRAEPGVLP